MSPSTSATRTIIRGIGDAAYPDATRRLVLLTLLLNVGLLSIRLGLLLTAIDPHRRYESIYGSSLPGTSVVALMLMRYGIPILLLIALGIWFWRDDEGGAATLYGIAAFVAIPFLFARYLGRRAADYPVSLSLHVLIAFWLVACGLITLAHIRRLRKFARRSQILIIETTA